jgi:hypothetical protein
MRKKCAVCEILLDVLCTNPACDGHRNESVGDVCVYCATHERVNMLFVWQRSASFCSSLADIGHGED